MKDNYKIRWTYPAAQAAPGRRTITTTEAAQSLGVSEDYFVRRIQPDLPTRSGPLIPVGEIDNWIRRNAKRPKATG